MNKLTPYISTPRRQRSLAGGTYFAAPLIVLGALLLHNLQPAAAAPLSDTEADTPLQIPGLLDSAIASIGHGTPEEHRAEFAAWLTGNVDSLRPGMAVCAWSAGGDVAAQVHACAAYLRSGEAAHPFYAPRELPPASSATVIAEQDQ